MKLSLAWPDPTPISLRPCEPWCGTKDHAEDEMDDRHCWGPRAVVDLTLEEPARYGGVWCHDRIEVAAMHWSNHDVPSVVLSHEGKAFEVSLRASEARELAAALLAVAEMLESGADDA